MQGRGGFTGNRAGAADQVGEVRLSGNLYFVPRDPLHHAPSGDKTGGRGLPGDGTAGDLGNVGITAQRVGLHAVVDAVPVRIHIIGMAADLAPEGLKVPVLVSRASLTPSPSESVGFPFESGAEKSMLATRKPVTADSVE